MVKLLILHTVRDAYAFVWRERRDFLSLAFPAIVVLAILSTLLAWLAKATTPTGTGEGNATIGSESLGAFAFGALVSIMVYVALWVMFAVAWHRRYLVPDEVVTVRAALRWGRRQTRFLLIAIGLFVLIALLWLIAGALGAGVFGAGILLMFPLFFLIGLVYARLSLLFPSTAVDHRMSFGECWEFTRGNSWRLIFIIVLVAIPVGVIALLMSLAVTTIVANFGVSDSLTTNFIVALIDQTFAFISIAVGVSALSIAYRGLMAGRRAASPTEG